MTRQLKILTKDGKKVSQDFRYASDNNLHWMKSQELQKWLIDDEESDDYGTMVEVNATYKIPSET